MTALISLALAFSLAAAAPNHDHDLDYLDENSRDADLLIRVYGGNSHLQRLLDLGLYQVVFDDDPEGVETFLAAGAHIEGLKDVALSPLAFATWRNESHTAAVLVRHGAKPVDQARDADALVRKTVETVTGVQDLLKRELVSAEGEYRKRKVIPR
ncbi:MAG: hypothetical protein JWM80_3511 [Cyanobacteria bacterium RYN_339]|nr:hypothetical protein [Cyanobacteria bacterium RYN_339]